MRDLAGLGQGRFALRVPLECYRLVVSCAVDLIKEAVSASAPGLDGGRRPDDASQNRQAYRYSAMR